MSLAFLCILSLPASAAEPAGKLLVLLSGQSKITLQGGAQHRTGYYFNELAIPLKMAVDAGFVPVFATPKGHAPVADPISDTDAAFGGDSAKYAEMKAFIKSQKGLAHPQTYSEILGQGVDQYSGMLVPGGHAPMEDMVQDANLGEILKQFHSRGKPTGMLCHGPVALLAAIHKVVDFFKMLSDPPMPKSLINGWVYRGYKMTVFSDEEEKVAEQGPLKGHVKFYVESTLRTAGGKLEIGEPWKSNVVRDRELITGQNPASTEEFGRALVAALQEKR